MCVSKIIFGYLIGMKRVKKWQHSSDKKDEKPTIKTIEEKITT